MLNSLTKKIIDTVKGQINLSDNFSISKNTRSQELKNYFGAEKFEISDNKSRWTNYNIRNIQLGDKYFSFIFYFTDDNLNSIDFVFNDSLIIGRTWDNWNEKEEMGKLEFFDKWLTEEIGNNRKFYWGTVDAYYDNKGGFSSILLKYVTT